MVIKINEEQLEMLENQAFEAYIDELVTHCNNTFPHLKESLGEKSLKQALKGSVKIAKQSGFTQQDTTRFYIDLMILLGSGFENDPQYAWIKKTLAEYKTCGELTQAEMLYYDADTFIKTSYGDKLNHRFDAITNFKAYLSKYGSNQLPQNIYYQVKNKKDYLPLATTQAIRIAPAKYRATSEYDFAELVSLGVERAQTLFMQNKQQDIITIILLMFIFGSSFETDPFLINVAKNKQDVPQYKNIANHTYRQTTQLNELFPWLNPFLELSLKQMLIKDS